MPGHRRRADKRDRVDVGMVEQRVDRLTRAMHHVEHALGKPRLEKDLGEALTAEWRPLRRLEHKRVSGDDRQREHPERDHHGEVERWDARAYADGVAIEVLVDTA